MKRYLVFAGSSYYPLGGWYDCAGQFDTIEECLTYLATHTQDWWHIVDTTVEGWQVVKVHPER